MPLIPLAHDKPVRGVFELYRRDGSQNGTVEVSLAWSHTYLPPAGATHTPAQEQLLSAVAGRDVPEKLPLLPGEEEQLRGDASVTRGGDVSVMRGDTSVIAGSPGVHAGPTTPQRPTSAKGPNAASTPMARGASKSRVKRSTLADSPLARAQDNQVGF